ncbi:hypothetical protein [Thalassotalea marina]|uniref:Uncharacterized protein n=1 Tax=Thalassotalea marina TaxID=1673741 RepID=A0A919EKN1_9GAMM|nr:hypothetical protein [Thalassotalea marina]GHF91119.1 hypothetical protein GCM10017161_18620 [Thalassotalea marina]
MKQQLDSKLFNGDKVEISFESFLFDTNVNIYHEDKWIREVASNSLVYDFKLTNGTPIKLIIDEVHDGKVKIIVNDSITHISRHTKEEKQKFKTYSIFGGSLLFFYFFLNAVFIGFPETNELRVREGQVIGFDAEGGGKHKTDLVLLSNKLYKTKLIAPSSNLKIGDQIKVKGKYNANYGAYKVYELHLNGKTKKTLAASFVSYYVFDVFGSLLLSIVLLCWGVERKRKYNKPLQ